jgi:hypothetical protein
MTGEKDVNALVREVVERALALQDAKQLDAAEEELEKRLANWADHMRGVSKDLARSALFQSNAKALPRQIYENRPVATLRNIRITYSGPELRQDDHDVFMNLVHMARKVDLQTVVRITGNEAMKWLHWERKGENYERLRQSYWRLLKGTVIVEREVMLSKGPKWRPIYGSHLVHTIDVVDDSSPELPWNIYLEPRLALLLTGRDMTLIDYMLRMKLKPLAQHLHAFYATHSDPIHPYSVASLRDLCGSQQKSLPAFRQQLKTALEMLRKEGFIQAWTLDSGDNIRVQKNPIGQGALLLEDRSK